MTDTGIETQEGVKIKLGDILSSSTTHTVVVLKDKDVYLVKIIDENVYFDLKHFVSCWCRLNVIGNINNKENFIDTRYTSNDKKIESFVDFLNDLDFDSIKKCFSIISNKIQSYVIGYIRIGSEYAPAISKEEAYQPLSSFGISNIFATGKFIGFPENKTMSDMKKDPIKFDEWCKENLVNTTKFIQ